MEPVKKRKVDEATEIILQNLPIPEIAPPIQQRYRRAKGNAAEKGTARKLGPKKWIDPTLQEWQNDDFRLWIGNIASVVDDEMLEKPFKKYRSLLKTKLIKDKRSGKNKGFGFVSFGNPDDYLRAFKEMNGSLIGGRPVILKKSDWKKRSN